MKAKGKPRARPGSGGAGTEIIEEQLADGSVRQFRRGRLLGKGGFANCYILREINTDETVAGKRLPKKGCSEAMRAQMLAEVEIHRTLGHEHVLRCFSAFETDAHVYLVLEVARHGTLQNIMEVRKRLTEPECQYYMPQLLSGLSYLDEIGVIHRDLTLNNLFVATDGRQLRLKIGDFGLAEWLLEGGVESSPSCCGTPTYMPPEVLRGAVVVGHVVQSHSGGHSPRSDVWAAGICLFAMLAGRPPFEGKDVDTTYGRIKSGRYSWPSVARAPSEDAAELVGLMLQLDPDDRPPASLLLQHPFLDPVARPLSLPLSTTKLCPKFDKFGRIDAAASQAAAKGCKSTGSAYGVPLKLARAPRNRLPPRECVLGPEALGPGAEGMDGPLRHLNLGGGNLAGGGSKAAGGRPPIPSPLWANAGVKRGGNGRRAQGGAPRGAAQVGGGRRAIA